MGVIGKWAEFVLGTRYSDIPEDLVKFCTEHIIDTVGVTLAGSAEPPGRIAAQYVKELGGTADATVFGANFKTSVVNAAFTNGIAGHCMDYDDTWLLMAHPSIVILPALFAIAEKIHASGKDIMTAYVVSLEFMGRIPKYTGDLFHRGWHPSGVWGGFGACAAVAKLIGLNKEQFKMAMGIAGSSASGLHKNRGTMGKSFHAGNANAAGIEAALMAKLGFTADPEIMHDAEGWAYAFAGDGNMNLEHLADNLGNPWTIRDMEPGLCIKKYPCGYSFHWALDAAMDLIKTHKITADQVKEVEIGVRPGKIYATDADVASRLRAKFSMEYLISAAIVDSQVSRHTFDDDKIDDPRIRDMMKRIRLKEYPLPPEYPLVHNNPVTITMEDGRSLRQQISYLAGYPNVPISKEQLLFKYRDCASAVLSSDKIEKSIEQLYGIVELKDITPLMQTLAAAPGQ